MKLMLIIVVLLLIISVGALFFVANFLFNGVLDRENNWFKDVAHGQVNSDIDADHGTELKEREVAQLEIGESVWNEGEAVQIQSFDGLTLRGRLIIAPEPTDKWVLCFHGYRTSGKVDNGYISNHLTSQGYHCLIVDQRAHGESQGRYLTMGWLERHDVLSWTDFIISEKAPAEIIWFGDSMGAATVLMASGESVPEVVHGIIADCGYTSIPDLFHYLLGTAFKVPSWVPILPFFNLIVKRKLGFSIYEASAYEQLKQNDLPILFIHGDADTFVPLSMSEKNRTATHGQTDLLVVKDAPHFSSILFDPVLYFEAIDHFLQKITD